MTREADVAEILRNDPTFVALAPGGIYTGQEIGVEGLRRGEDSPTKDAFDAGGQLKTCAIVVEGNVVPYGNNRNPHFTAVSQTVFIYYYEMRGHDEIGPLKERGYQLLQNARLPGSYPLFWTFDSLPVPDAGPVLNSTMVRQDWMVVSLREVA